MPSASLRLQQSSTQQLGAQQQNQQQDDLFTSSSQMPSNQGSFRFGNQNAVGQASQSNSADEFPPLNRNTLGEIGQDRTSNMIQNVGFGSQSNGAGFGPTTHPQQNRSNGLLNALSGSSRIASSNRVSSPASISGGEHRTFCIMRLADKVQGLSHSRSSIETSRHVSGATDIDVRAANSCEHLVMKLTCNRVFQTRLLDLPTLWRFVRILDLNQL